MVHMYHVITVIWNYREERRVSTTNVFWFVPNRISPLETTLKSSLLFQCCSTYVVNTHASSFISSNLSSPSHSHSSSNIVLLTLHTPRSVMLLRGPLSNLPRYMCTCTTPMVSSTWIPTFAHPSTYIPMDALLFSNIVVLGMQSFRFKYTAYNMLG